MSSALVVSMTSEEFQDGCDDNMGLCLSCGEQQGGCEPDAHDYECESCGALAVSGFEEALIMGMIEIEE